VRLRLPVVEGLYTRCDYYGKDEIPVALCEAAGLVGKRPEVL